MRPRSTMSQMMHIEPGRASYLNMRSSTVMARVLAPWPMLALPPHGQAVQIIPLPPLFFLYRPPASTAPRRGRGGRPAGRRRRVLSQGAPRRGIVSSTALSCLYSGGRSSSCFFFDCLLTNEALNLGSRAILSHRGTVYQVTWPKTQKWVDHDAL